MDNHDLTPYLKPQKRFLGGKRSTRAAKPSNQVEDEEEHSSFDQESQEPESDVSPQSKVSRTPSVPKKFFASSPVETGGPIEVNSALERTMQNRENTERKKSRKAFLIKIPFLDLNRKVSVRFVLASALAAALTSGLVFFMLGAKSARPQEVVQTLPEKPEITPEIQQALDEILTDLRNRRGSLALEKLQKLQSSAPGLPSLFVLSANAALLENDLEKAASESQEGLLRKEFESDAYMLQALVMISQLRDKTYKTMGNPKARIESLLRQAMAVDPLNPDPYTMLAAIKRAARESREALALLHSSRLRQTVASDTIVTDIAIRLVELEMLLDSDLPALSEKPEDGVLQQISAAYIAMRLGNSEAAIANLTLARKTLPAEIFIQILSDPAFQPYFKNSAFADFFKKK